MGFLVATAEGLLDVDEAGRVRPLVSGSVRHVVAGDEGSVALADDGSLWSIDEDGASEFHEFDRPPAHRPTCLVVDGDDVWLGTEGAHLLLLRDGQVSQVAAFDRVEGRDRWHTPWGGPPAVRSLDVNDDSHLYVAVHVGGIVRSLDGRTWSPTVDVDLDVHQVLTVPGEVTRVLAPCARGLAVTDDQGETWRVDAEGLVPPYSRSAAIAGDTLVLGTAAGPDGDDAALFWRRLDDTGPFHRSTAGLPERLAGMVDTHCLAAWDELVVAVTTAGTLFSSSNGGVTWKELVTGLPAPLAVAVT